MEKINLKVEGMVCTGCENRIKNTLESIKGVKEVSANHESGMVTVTVKNKIDQKLLEEKLNDLDFKVIKD